MSELPKFVNVRDANGCITTMSYCELKEHEEAIIEDNICYGLIHTEYSDKEISDYEKQAKAEWRELKNKLRNNPELLLTWIEKPKDMFRTMKQQRFRSYD